MPFEPGRILLVTFPFTDHVGGKLRPALVVSSRRYNRAGDFVAVPISSRLNPDGFPIRSVEPYFLETKLRAESTVRWTKLMTLNASVVHKKLGMIPAPVLAEIQDHIREMFV